MCAQSRRKAPGVTCCVQSCWLFLEGTWSANASPWSHTHRAKDTKAKAKHDASAEQQPKASADAAPEEDPQTHEVGEAVGGGAAQTPGAAEGADEAVEEAAKAADEGGQKRRRGRPRKHEPYADAAPEGDAGAAQGADEAAEEAPKAGDEAGQKRRRGRPRKHQRL